MKGGIGWKLITIALSFATHESYMWCSYLMKLIYNFVKFIRKLIYLQFCIKVMGLKRSNSANMHQSENDDIPEKANCNLGLPQF